MIKIRTKLLEIEKVVEKLNDTQYLLKNDETMLGNLEQLMELSNDEFVPSLTSYKPISEHMAEYLELQEAIYISHDNEKMAAVAVFYLIDNSLHIDGIITHPSERNKGHAQKLYKVIDEIAKVNKVDKITLTTWSTNKPQLHILKKIGYSQVVCEERMKGVHTVKLHKAVY